MSSDAGSSVKEAVARGIARRYRNEAIFRGLGLGALLLGLGFLAFFFYTLIGNGYTALQQTRILLDVEFDAAVIDQTILDTMARPAERVVPWFEYRNIFLTEERIAETEAQDELEHEIVRLARLLEPVDRRDVGMVQRREDFGLALKTPESLLVSRELVGQDFNRDVPAELRVLCPIHFAHAALADELEDVVVRELRPWCE